MKTNVLLKLLAILFAFGVIAISCEDELNILDEEPDVTSVEENAGTEVMVFGVLENVNNYGISEEGTLKSAFADSGDFEDWDLDEFILTLNFDMDDDVNTDGLLIIDFNMDPTWDAIGLTATIEAQNYQVGASTLNGIIMFSLSVPFDPEGGDNPELDIVTDGDLMVIEGSDTSYWNGNRHIEWTEGYATLDVVDDDVFAISGASTGINSNGTPYSVTLATDDPLIQAVSCEWIKDGTMTLTENPGTEDQSQFSMDFGAGETSDVEGECDNWVEITVGSFTFTTQI
jgi:hypothetical protein